MKTKINATNNIHLCKCCKTPLARTKGFPGHQDTESSMWHCPKADESWHIKLEQLWKEYKNCEKDLSILRSISLRQIVQEEMSKIMSHIYAVESGCREI